MILHTWAICNLQYFPSIRNVYERSLKLRKQEEQEQTNLLQMKKKFSLIFSECFIRADYLLFVLDSVEKVRRTLTRLF